MKALALCIFFLINPFTGNHDFRELDWGMTINEVKQAETLQLKSQIGSQLRYTKSLNGINCSLIYYFTQGRLSKAVYSSKESYLDYNDYIKDYQALKNILVKKYGQPLNDDQNWTDPKNKEQSKDNGTAVSNGQLQYAANWSNDRTRIEILLKGVNKKCDLSISYTAKDTKWNTQGKDADDAMDDL